MTATTRDTRRSELELYFDRTAVEAWKRLTSDAPVSGIRAQVRAGRDAMRDTLLSWLPQDMRGLRVLDAGCGTGALAVEAARRGADVLAIDISPSLVDMARERAPKDLGAGSITFAVGDIAQTLASLAQRTRGSMVFTVAPRTPALTLLWVVGRMFPRSDRAPAIEPIAQNALERHMGKLPELNGWTIHRSQRVSRSFYISEALEVKRS